MNNIDQFAMETVDAISHLVRADRWLQALVLLYSAIDTLAWSNRNEGDVTRSDFCRWVSVYMDPGPQLNCTPDDLYAARCALLHSGAAQSKLSREGNASELWYATSPHSIPQIQAFAKQVEVDAKIVYVTALVAAFSEGAMKFSDELSFDDTRRRETTERIRRWLRFVPSSSVRNGWEQNDSN